MKDHFPLVQDGQPAGHLVNSCYRKGQNNTVALGDRHIRLESYLVMMEGFSQAWRARLQKGSQALQASWGLHRGGTSPLTARGTKGSEEKPKGGEGGAGAKGF